VNVFRRLAAPGALLVHEVSSDAPNSREGCRRGGRANKAAGGKVFTATADELRTWLGDGLIEARGPGYALSATGLAWLRRQLASADAFQAQHQARSTRDIDYGGTKRPAVVNDSESPLAWLASRKDKNGVPLLAPFQFRAGERLRADYHYAGLTARVTANWGAAASSSGNSGGSNDLATLTDNVLAARHRVVRALAAVGPELSGILVDVCCHLKGLEEAEKAEGWPQRSGKVVLQIALTRLARHYGLISDGRLTAGLKHKIQQWGTEDYRPEIGGAGGGEEK
jgi:hypothetical protein